MGKLYLSNFVRVFGDLSGVKVLDLGCGSDEPNKLAGLPDSFWRSSLSKELQKVGADVTGIDSRGVMNSVYNHVVGDLTQEKLSDIVVGEKYNIVIAKSFFDSWQLAEGMEESGACNVYAHHSDGRRDERVSFTNGLVGEVSRVLKDDGFFLVGPMKFFCDVEYDPRDALKRSGFLRDFAGDVDFFKPGDDLSLICEKYDKIEIV